MPRHCLLQSQRWRWLPPLARITRKTFVSTLCQGIKILPMPQLSPTMTHGKIVKWHVKEGTHLQSYNLLLEIVTDTLEKNAAATVFHMDIEIIEDMILAKVIGEENCEYKVGTPIATLCEDESLVESAKQLQVSLRLCICILESVICLCLLYSLTTCSTCWIST